MLLLLKLPHKIMKYSTKRAYKVIYTEPTLVILLVVSDLWCSLLLQNLISYCGCGDLTIHRIPYLKSIVSSIRVS